MEPDFSLLFHRSSKSLSKGHPPISEDSSEWPEEWRTTYYKAYHRMPSIPLVSLPPQADFFTLIKNRVSSRDFSSQPLSLQSLSVLMEYSCGNTQSMGEGRLRRAQPSGGARFPIEMYALVLKDGEGVSAGLYHYNVKQNALEVLLKREMMPEQVGALFTYDWVEDASCVFLMTAVFERNQMKYGERGYRYILIEAGHIGQNLYLAATALGIKCVGLGGTRDEALEKLLDIDGVQESIVYAIALGK